MGESFLPPAKSHRRTFLRNQLKFLFGVPDDDLGSGVRNQIILSVKAFRMQHISSQFSALYTLASGKLAWNRQFGIWSPVKG